MMNKNVYTELKKEFYNNRGKFEYNEIFDCDEEEILEDDVDCNIFNL